MPNCGPSRFDGAFTTTNAAGKKFRKYPRKPLIRLVSHERIQGNPSFSNHKFGGFGNETASRQENPNELNRLNFALSAAAEGAKPALFK
jgi:hypothetical protein